jgi:hypothetical protein
MSAPVYIGLFLTEESRGKLLGMYKPLHKNVHADHVTLVFKPHEEVVKLVQSKIGTKMLLCVRGLSWDEKCQTAVVSLDSVPFCANKTPHITISCADGVKPSYSNELLAKAPLAPFSGTTLLLEGVLDFYPRTTMEMKAVP